MKKNSLKQKFLDELSQYPVVSSICKKCVVSRNTYYRWCKEDIDFRIGATEAISMGMELICDFAENNVFKGVRDGDQKYTFYLLNKRHQKYKNSFYSKEPTPLDVDLEKRKIKEAVERLKRFEDKWFVKPDKK